MLSPARGPIMNDFWQTDKCEACGKIPTRLCVSTEEPGLAFCEKCYWEHVRAAHGGRELVGSSVIRRGGNMNVLGSIRKDGGACTKPSEPRSTQEPMGQTPTPLQGMSAKQEAEILVDSLSSTDHIVVTREQYEYLVSAIVIGFTNREAVARNKAIEDAVEVCAVELDADDLAYRLRQLKLPEAQPVESTVGKP